MSLRLQGGSAVSTSKDTFLILGEIPKRVRSAKVSVIVMKVLFVHVHTTCI